MVNSNIIRFEDFGKDWACFKIWQKYERKNLQEKNLEYGCQSRYCTCLLIILYSAPSYLPFTSRTKLEAEPSFDKLRGRYYKF